MATESLVALVVFALLFAAFAFYVGSHREQDHQPRCKVERDWKLYLICIYRRGDP